MRRRAALVLGTVVLALVLASCSAISSLTNTTRAVQDAGFQSVSVSIVDPNSLKVSASVSAEPTASDVRLVAQAVWDNFHERFDYLYIYVHGDGSEAYQPYSFDQVQSLFGPRNASWNSTTLQSSAVHAVLYTVIVVIGAGVVVAVIVILLVRRNRRNRPVPAGPWGGGYSAGAYPPGPYPSQPWPSSPYPPAPSPPPGPPSTYPPGPPQSYSPFPPPASYPPGPPAAPPAPHPSPEEPQYPPPAEPPYPVDPPEAGPR